MLGFSGVRSSLPGSDQVGGTGWTESASSPLPEGHTLGSKEILFHKVTDDMIQSQIDKLESADSNSDSSYAESKSIINFDHFSQMDLRVGHILSAEPVKKSKKLLKLQVALGYETRQILLELRSIFKQRRLWVNAWLSLLT